MKLSNERGPERDVPGLVNIASGRLVVYGEFVTGDDLAVEILTDYRVVVAREDFSVPDLEGLFGFGVGQDQHAPLRRGIDDSGEVDVMPFHMPILGVEVFRPARRAVLAPAILHSEGNMAIAEMRHIVILNVPEKGGVEGQTQNGNQGNLGKATHDWSSFCSRVFLTILCR